ncbi:hypothetical protein N7499_004033 [Penicillium canescens]|nr:hypothetical protein N7499_004033 [Penicillium canescens]
MANTKSFRGYTGLGNERTAAKADERETFWAGLHEILDSSELPVWYNLVGPNQWPAETSAVGFRKSVEAYLAEIEHLSERFTGLVAEALDTDPSVFAKFFKKPCMSGRQSGRGQLGTRLSFPFFQMFGFDVTQEDIRLDIPDHITSLRDESVRSDAESFFGDLFKTVIGEAFMINALTSHPEVGKRWYPEALTEALKKQEEGKKLDNAKAQAAECVA